jgi:hypothetical protein
MRAKLIVGAIAPANLVVPARPRINTQGSMVRTVSDSGSDSMREDSPKASPLAKLPRDGHRWRSFPSAVPRFRAR